MALSTAILKACGGDDGDSGTTAQKVEACSVDLVGCRSGVSRGSRDSGSAPPPNADFDLDREPDWDHSVDELLPRVSGLVAQANPDVVMIHLGTNDVLRGQSAGGIAQELGRTIDAIRASKPDAHILLAKIIPASPNVSGTAALNRLIDGLAAGRNTATSPIRVVDQASGYGVGNNHDGVHPAASGEAMIGNKWADALLAWRQR